MKIRNSLRSRLLGSGMRGGVRMDGGDLAAVRALVKEVQTGLETRDKEIQAAIAKANEEIKAAGVMSAESKAALDKLAKDGTAQQTRLQALEQKIADLKMVAAVNRNQTVGANFVADEKVKAVLAARSGKARMTMPHFFNAVTELTSGAGAAGELIVPQRIAGIITPANRKLRVRDLLPKGRTSSNAIEFVQETGFTNAAAVVAEGATKPESSLEFAMQSAPVRTLAHWLQASKQILDDVPQLQSYIDTRLQYGLALVEEEELLAGDGTGQHLLGLIPQATAFDTARRKDGDTRIDIVRRAMTQLRISEYQPDAIVLHPTDWEDIELTKSTTGEYIWANPRGLLGPTLWGLPVVDSTSLSEGEFLVGAFGVAAQIWDREQAAVEISTEDQDNFIKNMVTIRAEERLALTVYRPESFIYGDFDSIVST